jgi:hypothetical protein
VVIDHLRSTFADQDFAMAFFYFDYRDPDYQSPANVAASILKPLASQKPTLPLPVAELHERFQKTPDHPQLQDLETTLLLCVERSVKSSSSLMLLISAMQKNIGNLF